MPPLEFPGCERIRVIQGGLGANFWRQMLHPCQSLGELALCERICGIRGGSVLLAVHGVLKAGVNHRRVGKIETSGLGRALKGWE